MSSKLQFAAFYFSIPKTRSKGNRARESAPWPLHCGACTVSPAGFKATPHGKFRNAFLCN